MFETHRKDWIELLTLFRLLNEDTIARADHKGRPTNVRVALNGVSRQEENGFRRYRRTPDAVVITNDAEPTAEPISVPLDLWEAATAHAFELLREAGTEEQVLIDDETEAFLDEIRLLSIGGTAEGRHHLVLSIEGEREGSAIHLSRAGAAPSVLLDGGRTANMKLEQTGTRFATPMAAKVNYLESENTIRDRMLLVERMGSSLRYHNVADRVFRANLALIDLHLGRLLTEMLRMSYMEDLMRLDDLVAACRVLNPLKVSTELIEKHRYYEHKIAQLLLACLAGMRPGKIYHGETSLPPYLVLLAPDSTPVLFDTAEREALAQFLLSNTRLLRGSMEKDKYGFLERENNVYYFKLNLKIGLTKR